MHVAYIGHVEVGVQVELEYLRIERWPNEDVLVDVIKRESGGQSK